MVGLAGVMIGWWVLRLVGGRYDRFVGFMIGWQAL